MTEASYMADHPAIKQLVGIDVGGTFTDFVFLAGDRLEVLKVATTPEDQSRAIVAGLRTLDVADTATVVHGTTTATNALLERRGARTALLATRGFADTLAIGRQDRPELYSLSQQRAPTLVPRSRRFEIVERLGADGAVLSALDESALAAIADTLESDDVESLAVVFLFSFLNPEHERRAASVLRSRLPQLSLSLSVDILPEYREYERTATTVINAYVQPLVGSYLNMLGAALKRRRVWVMQSNGGTIGIAQASVHAARLVLSGPAGGVVGAFELARRAMQVDAPRLLTFDMGGTSTDVALCPGEIPQTTESMVADLPLRLPSTQIHTVGAGGGSLARMDAGGILRVGPQSAGADPGPACYGKGGKDVTVTDANLVLGRLDARYFLGGTGSKALDADAAHRALERLGAGLGMGPEEAALGVIRVVNASMERALRRVSVERGYDPRGYVLAPFGGAGPLHACDLAEALGIRRIMAPPHPGVLSALGLLLADIVCDRSHTVLTPLDRLVENPSLLHAELQALTESINAVLQHEGAVPVMEAFLDIRYTGQSYELEIPLALPAVTEHIAQVAEKFHGLHEQRYGYATRDRALEAVTLRLRGRIPGARPSLAPEPASSSHVAEASLGAKPVCFGAEGPVETACYDRSRLRHGHLLHGPAVVYQYDATVVVSPGWRLRVDAWRNAWIERD